MLQATGSITRLAWVEFFLVLLAMIVWQTFGILSGRRWESLGDALGGILLMCVCALVAVSITASVAAVMRLMHHRVARWFAILPAVLVLFLLLLAVNTYHDIFFIVFGVSATVGIWVGVSRRWSQQFQAELLSAGAVALAAADCLSALMQIHKMEPFPTVFLIYAICAAGIASLFSHTTVRLKFWRAILTH